MQRTTNPPVVQASIHPTRLQFPDDFQAIFLNFNNCYWITAIRYLEHKLHINHSCPLALLLLFSLINDVTYNILMVAGIKLARRLIDRSFTIQACPANCGICKITVLIYVLSWLHIKLHCDNYVPKWWVEFDDDLSWLFTNRFRATRYMKVIRMGITEILRRIFWK